MKDYTKYNFNAIIGAEISIILKNEIEWGGTLELVDKKNKAIFILLHDNPLEGHLFAIDDILSLTARIKVEDMSVKQLKSLLEKYQDPRIEHIFVIAENGVHHSIMSTWEEVGKHDFTDYLDCTEWGWEK